MKPNIYILIILVVLSFSCKNQKGRDILLPSVTGKAGEVILVMEDDYWKSKIGEKWKEICGKNVICLPQIEPMFDLVRIPKDAFTNIFKSHRNIILMNLDSSLDSAEMIVQQDIWSRPQLLITISAPDKNKYYDIITQNEQKISDLLLGAERQRIINNYKKYEERDLRKQLEKNHNISLRIPKGYKLDVDSANFVWISHETPYISQGLFIYYYDYTDTLQFEKENLIKKRNEVLKKHVPGDLPGSYMITETEFPIDYEQFYLNDRYIAQLKGLWKTEKDFMGGPFHSFSTVDEGRNRIITVEGYLFSPKFKKRNYMRQLEAIMFTLKIL